MAAAQPLALRFEAHPDRVVWCALLRGVRHLSKALKEAAATVEAERQQSHIPHPVLLLNAAHVVSVMQLHVAAATALQRQAHGLVRGGKPFLSEVVSCLCTVPHKTSMARAHLYTEPTAIAGAAAADVLVVMEGVDEAAFVSIASGAEGARWAPVAELDSDLDGISGDGGGDGGGSAGGGGAVTGAAKATALRTLHRVKERDMLGGGAEGLERAILTLMAARDHM